MQNTTLTIVNCWHVIGIILAVALFIWLIAKDKKADTTELSSHVRYKQTAEDTNDDDLGIFMH